MRTYILNEDEQHKIPADATNLRKERVRGVTKIRFQSDTGPVEDDEDEHCCEQCKAVDEGAEPDSLAPRRSTPTGWADK